MPFKSKAQARLMYAAMNDKKVAEKTGVPQKVAKEFVEATPKGKWKKLKEKLGKK